MNSDNNQDATLLQTASRRGFMKGASALGMAAALTPGSVMAATPKKGGHIRIGLGHGSTTDSLDPATFENLYMQVVGATLRNGLTEVDQNGNLVPELAESFHASPDGRVWSFRLRKGIKFHRGKVMDSGDVIASINHHRGTDSKSAAKKLLQPIVEMKADGPNALVITLSDGNADFPYIISDYHIPIMPKKGNGVDWQSGDGTGVMVLQKYEPGVRTTMKRNPDFFKKGMGHFNSAEVIAIADGTARTNALATGEIDVMDKVDLKTAHLLKRRKGIRILETSGNQHFTFAMRCDTPPFDDVNVRKALKYSIDREAIMKTVLKGHGTIGNDHPISSASSQFGKDLPQKSYDIDKAKFYLAKSGITNLKIDLSAADSAFAGSVDAAILFKEHARPAGIDINVIREPNDGYWSKVWMQKPFCAVYWGGRSTADWMFSTAYAADAAWNDSFWKHPHFNDLLLKARAELDNDKRNAMYAEMQAIVSDEGGVLIPMFANYVMATSDKVEHGPVAANWAMDGFKAIERWWFG